jgi:pilus assembly protein CpaF
MNTTPNNHSGPNGAPADDQAILQRIKAQVHQRLLEVIDFQQARHLPADQLYEECSRRVNGLLTEQQCPLSAPEKYRLLGEVMDEVFGLGPIEEFRRDPAVCDILVNGPSNIYIERDGRLERTTATFRDENHLMRVIQRIAAGAGRRIDESSPMLDAHLPDGSRVNAIIPPLALEGPTLSIRRFATTPIDIPRMIALNSLVPAMVLFLEVCVRCKTNILISGGTGTGKTTLLNALSKWIPPGERVITIEDAAELQLQREHVVRLETRPPNIEGRGEVTQRDLLRNALRMRPDRIIIGEVRGPEALDMLQAMNTGHEGSMTTVHANNPRDALRRVENMVSMGGLNYPVHVIRQQLSSALQLLVHVDRVTGGRRKIVQIAEITGMEGDVICLQDLFQFAQTGVGGDGHAQGRFEACGVRPMLLERMKAEGVALPDTLFMHRVLSRVAVDT